MRVKPDVPAEIEDFRDHRWRRDEMRAIQTALDAERFIEQAGFAACLTDSRRPGPSLYVAVCGRRDAVLPRHVQKDPEASHTWFLKDDIVRRGKVYYGKLTRGKAMFLAPRMIPYFHAIRGVRPAEAPKRLSRDAQKVLRSTAPRMGDGDVGSAQSIGGHGSRGVHPRDRRASSRDDRRAERRRLSALHLHLDAGGGPIPGPPSPACDRETALREIARAFWPAPARRFPASSRA